LAGVGGFKLGTQSVQNPSCEARSAKQDGGRGRDRTDMTEVEEFEVR